MAEEFWKTSPFGEDSYFHPSWEEKQRLQKEQLLNSPKILNTYLIDYNSFVKGKPLYSIRSKKNSFVLVITLNEQPNKVEVYLNGQKKHGLRELSLKGYVYVVFYDNLIQPPFQYQNIVFEIKVYNTLGTNPSDVTTLKTIVDIDKNVVSSINQQINNRKNIEQIEFHVYANHTIEKWKPKNYNEEIMTGKIKYFYHDIEDNLFEIAEVDFHFAQKRKNGCKTVDCTKNGAKITKIPENYIETYDYPTGGNAKTAYVYENGDVYVDGTQYGIRKYPKDKGFVQLIRMPDSLNIKESSFLLNYKFSGSQRRYCNPESFAGFIGALAEISKPVTCTGMCFKDATSYPSVSHPNGDSADTAYFATLEEEQRKVDAFYNFHFTHIYRGNSSWYPQLKNTKYADGHNDHLHAGEFNSDIVKLKIVG